MDPAGRLARVEDVGHRRKVNQVDPARVLPNIPGMGMPEDVSLDLFSGPNDREERCGVFQTADVPSETRVVMNQHQRGFVGGWRRAHRASQSNCSWPKQARRGERLFERVEHEPIRPRQCATARPAGRPADVWRLFPAARPPRSARGYRGCPTPDAPASGPGGSVPASPPRGDSRPSARCYRRNRRR